MRVYESDNIRNIAIVGHGAAGKTTLTSAMLFDSGAVSRLGRVEDGNTVTDWEDEEIERKITISTGVAHCEWNKRRSTSWIRPDIARSLPRPNWLCGWRTRPWS